MNDSVLMSVLGRNDHSMEDLLSLSPEILQLLNRHRPISYEHFVEQLDIDLDNIISNTESGKKQHHTKSEDSLTEHMIAQLKTLYPSAHHDALQGGHCDYYIEIKSFKGVLYKWIMEAKLWGGYEYGHKGLFNQLLGSYASGALNNNQGGMIFYSQIKSGGKFVMDSWRKGLEDNNIKIENLRSDGLKFSTKHLLNDGNGPEYNVVHYCVDVYHQPTQDSIELAKDKQDKEINDYIDREVKRQVEEKLAAAKK